MLQLQLRMATSACETAARYVSLLYTVTTTELQEMADS